MIKIEEKDLSLIASYSFDEVKDEIIGPKGTANRDTYELELKLDILGEMIKRARKERDLTQAQLGKLVGVQKAQISKLEKNPKNVTIDTILKIFKALGADVKLKVELADYSV